MLPTAAGTRVDSSRGAPRVDGDPAVHQLNARLALRFYPTGGRTRLHVEEQQPPWKVVRAFEQTSAHKNGAALVHLHNVSGGVLAGVMEWLEEQRSHGLTASGGLTASHGLTAAHGIKASGTPGSHGHHHHEHEY